MGMLHDLFHWFSHLEAGDDECFFVTIKEHDTLRGIAKKMTGDEERFTELVDANPDHHFDDKYTIHPNERFRMPHDWLED
jgi:nucleoid-associated protein YgaU